MNINMLVNFFLLKANQADYLM